jgi:hypothetical protein
MAKEQRKVMKIRWLVRDDLRPGFGHGLEFWYSQGETRNEETDILAAIVEGFRWYHKPDQKGVTVKILSGNSPILGRSEKRADDILDAVRIGVRKFFEKKPSDNRVTKDVRVWWNG